MDNYSYPNLLAQDSQIKGVWWTIHQQHGDDRGSMTEAAVNTVVKDLTHQDIRQVNVSLSRARVMRAMHFHAHQADAWYVVGGIMQVMTQDLHTGETDSRVLYPGSGVIIPPRVGHGFLALDDLCLIYATTREYQTDPDEYTYDARDVKGWMIHPIDCVRSERDAVDPMPLRQFQSLVVEGVI